jgi:hypothetical protein
MHGFRWYPAAWASALGTVLAALVAFSFMTPTVAGYVSTAGVGVIGLVTAMLARPWDLPVAGAALSTALTAFTAFGLKWDDQQIAIVVTIVMGVFGFVIHSLVTPKAGSPAAADPSLAPLRKVA